MQAIIDKAHAEACASTSSTPEELNQAETYGETIPNIPSCSEDPQKSLITVSDSPGVAKLRSWLNKSLRIEMSDKRVLVGVFLCTDRDANVILGVCSEYLPDDEGLNEEPRMLGLVMVPGKHIVSVSIDENSTVHSTSESLDDHMNDENIV